MNSLELLRDESSRITDIKGEISNLSSSAHGFREILRFFTLWAKKNSGFKYTSGLTQFCKFTNNVNLSVKIHAPHPNFGLHHASRINPWWCTSFLSWGNSPEGPAKECADSCKDSAPIIFGEMVNSCSCSVKISSSCCIILLHHTSNASIPLIFRRHLAHEESNGRESDVSWFQGYLFFKADRPMNHRTCVF